MHALAIRTFTCNWVSYLIKTQYAAETPGAKVGGSVFVDLDAYQFSPNPFLDNSRVTNSPRMSFSLRPKLTRNAEALRNEHRLEASSVSRSPRF